jgi:hypothetical protein
VDYNWGTFGEWTRPLVWNSVHLKRNKNSKRIRRSLKLDLAFHPFPVLAEKVSRSESQNHKVSIRSQTLARSAPWTSVWPRSDLGMTWVRGTNLRSDLFPNVLGRSVWGSTMSDLPETGQTSSAPRSDPRSDLVRFEGLTFSADFLWFWLLTFSDLRSDTRSFAQTSVKSSPPPADSFTYF